MIDYTEEQRADIQRQKDEVARYEQWRTAYAQAYRLVIPYLEGMVDQYDPQTKQLLKRGVIDPFVLTVFTTELNNILESYFPTAKPPASKKPIEPESPDE